MANPLSALVDLDQLDLLATRELPINRVDSRAKLIVTAVFIVCVVSFERHTVSALLPFFLFPVVLLCRGIIPVSYLFRQIALAFPFAFLAGICNPFLDRQVVLIAGLLPVTGGWLSFSSILLRFVLTVSAALILLATTGFHNVCQALERLGAPRLFVLQLLFMYRFLFVLGGEASRMALARELRSFGTKGRGYGSAAAAIGCLLSRCIERSQRIHDAMLARGFQGIFHGRHKQSFGWSDLIFCSGWCAAFLLMRLYDVPGIIGNIIGRLL